VVVRGWMGVLLVELLLSTLGTAILVSVSIGISMWMLILVQIAGRGVIFCG
jgi:hypothetical protein